MSPHFLLENLLKVLSAWSLDKEYDYVFVFDHLEMICNILKAIYIY